MKVNSLARLGLIGAAALTAGLAFAQPASAPAPGASAGMDSRPVPRSGNGFTPGWHMMSTAERAAHQVALSQLTTRGECLAFVNDHFRQMTARSLQRGLPMGGSARPDVCNVLPQ